MASSDLAEWLVDGALYTFVAFVAACVAFVAFLLVWLLGAYSASLLGDTPPQAVYPDDTIDGAAMVASPEYVGAGLVALTVLALGCVCIGAVIDRGPPRLRAWREYLTDGERGDR